ncbi:VOC family protein [Streptomyces sp. NPDC058375]|uniref:VOC family protein n=1 Tax=Streptomyces sp. NPDC058375 TaxID=3346467 RepID=UPI00365A93F8
MTAFNDHIGLSVGDLDRVSSFYCQALGMTNTGTHVLADGLSRVAMLVGSSNLCLELTEITGSLPAQPSTVTEGARVQGWFHWSVRVDDLDTVLSAVTALGGRTVSEPARAQTRPEVSFAYVADPEGNLLELTQVAG